jgi:hypothetical protein
VFAFSVTQVTTLISNRLSWAGFGQGMIVLALGRERLAAGELKVRPGPGANPTQRAEPFLPADR